MEVESPFVPADCHVFSFSSIAAPACSTNWWFNMIQLCYQLLVSRIVLLFGLAKYCLSLCRERGQRALEQRLAEKLAAVRSSEGTSLDAADKVWVFYATSYAVCESLGLACPCDFLKDRKNEEHAFTFSSPCLTLVFIFSNWEYRSIALHFFPKVPL